MSENFELTATDLLERTSPQWREDRAVAEAMKDIAHAYTTPPGAKLVEAVTEAAIANGHTPNDLTWADARKPGDFVVDHEMVREAQRRAEEKVEKASTYVAADEGTEKAIKGFQEFVDKLSTEEKLEALGLEVTKYTAPLPTAAEEHGDRLVITLLADLYSAVNAIADEQKIPARDAMLLVKKALAQVYEKFD